MALLGLGQPLLGKGTWTSASLPAALALPCWLMGFSMVICWDTWALPPCSATQGNIVFPPRIKECFHPRCFLSGLQDLPFPVPISSPSWPWRPRLGFLAATSLGNRCQPCIITALSVSQTNLQALLEGKQWIFYFLKFALNL